MTDSLREAIARAMHKRECAAIGGLFGLPEYDADLWEDRADAALSAIRESGCVVVPVETVKRIMSYRTSATGLGRANSEEYRKGCNDMGDWIKREVLDALSASPYEVKP